MTYNDVSSDNAQSGKPTIRSDKIETVGNKETKNNGEIIGLNKASFSGFDERFTRVMFILKKRNLET